MIDAICASADFIAQYRDVGTRVIVTSQMLPADFDVGRALLLKGTQPGTWQEVQARITEEFLPDLCTARQTLDKSEGQNLPRTLPGIGHEFWLYSRAHIYCGTLPPSMPEAVVAIAEALEIVTAQRMIKTIQGSLRLEGR